MLRYWRWKTIRGKFLMLTLLLTVVPMVALSIIFYRIAEHSLGNKAEEHAMQTRLMGENDLNGTITDLNDLTNAILGNPAIQEMMTSPAEDDYEYLRDADALIRVIRSQTQTKPYIISSLVYAADGGPKRSFYQGDASIRFGGIPTLTEARRYYDGLRADNRLLWHDGSPFPSAEPGNNHLYVGKLLRKTDGNNDDLGFLLLEIEKSRFFRGISFLKTDQMSQVWVIDDAGRAIYRLPEDAAADAAALKQIAAQAQVKAKLDKGWVEWNGRHTMITYAPLAYNGWTLLYRVDGEVLLEDARQIGRWTVQIFLVVLLFGWIIAYRLSDTIRRPLSKLRGLMTVSGSAAPPIAGFDAGDEVGQIGERFLRMMKENESLNRQVYEALLSRKEAEFRALQAQINPHFLYNTLEALNGLALANKQREMSEVIGALGKFFRISLSGGSEEITVNEEIGHVCAYVKVQQFRFRGKFEWICEIEDGLPDCGVPKLILQPLVENAIYHGLKGRKETAYIMMTAARSQGDLQFTVSDDGDGIAPQRLEAIRASLDKAEAERDSAIGFGLKNVHARLQHYGPQYGIRIVSEQGKFTTVTLTVPIKTIQRQGGVGHASPADRG